MEVEKEEEESCGLGESGAPKGRIVWFCGDASREHSVSIAVSTGKGGEGGGAKEKDRGSARGCSGSECMNDKTGAGWEYDIAERWRSGERGGVGQLSCDRCPSGRGCPFVSVQFSRSRLKSLCYAVTQASEPTSQTESVVRPEIVDCAPVRVPQCLCFSTMRPYLVTRTTEITSHSPLRLSIHLFSTHGHSCYHHLHS